MKSTLFKAIKTSLLTILVLCVTLSYAQDPNAQNSFFGSKQSYQITGNQLTIIAVTSFGHGPPGICFPIDSFIVIANNSILTVDLYYDPRGVWQTQPCVSYDTVVATIDTNATSLFVNTNLIEYGNTIEDSIFTKVQTDTVFHKPIKNVNVNVYSTEDGVSIYPNPTNRFLNIDVSENTQIKNLRIYNVNGTVVKRFSEKEEVLNLSGLVSGIYFIRLETNKGLVTKKILVE